MIFIQIQQSLQNLIIQLRNNFIGQISENMQKVKIGLF